jgi:hypoxanthine phosphoribosyltransferase
MSDEKRYLSFDDVEALVHKIVDDVVEGDFIVDEIIGISRGGLVPAVMLSHILDKPLRVINYSTRDKMVEGSSAFKWASNKKRYLLVDDIYDTGLTISTIVKKLESSVEDLFVATLVANANGSADVFLDSYGVSNSDGGWVVFPWERAE